MNDDRSLVDFIERSIDRDPSCPACGAPTDVRDRNGALVLECSTIGTAQSRIERLIFALIPHHRVVLLAAEERAA